MALFFKCPKCGRYYMDMFGEFAAGPGVNNCDYICSECGVPMDSIEEEEYHNAPEELQLDMFKIIDEKKNHK